MISKERYRGFLDGDKGEFPGSWKLRNQEANGPFRGSSFQVFRASEKFQIWKSLRRALLPLIGLGWTVPGFFAARRRGSSPAAGNPGTRKQMALFGGRVSRFLGSPKSFRFENLRGVQCRHLLVSEDRRRDFLDEARGEFPGSWKLSNQEANGPFWGSSFQVFRASEKFQIWKPSWCAQCRHLWVSKERYRDFVDGKTREFTSSWKPRNQEAHGPFWGSSFQVFRASKKFQI